VTLVDNDPEVEAKLADTTEKLALAVVSTLAVVSRLVVLVESDDDVVAKLEDTMAKLAEAVVSTEAVDSRLVNLTLLLPDC